MLSTLLVLSPRIVSSGLDAGVLGGWATVAVLPDRRERRCASGVRVVECRARPVSAAIESVCAAAVSG
jgi:hypothetical protein